MRPLFTTFTRSAMLTNLLTVLEWRRFAKAVGKRSWESAARYYALRFGGALVLRADDTLVVLTRLESGKLRRKTYRPGTWRWEAA